jgi:hypothetical protein
MADSLTTGTTPGLGDDGWGGHIFLARLFVFPIRKIPLLNVNP